MWRGIGIVVMGEIAASDLSDDPLPGDGPGAEIGDEPQYALWEVAPLTVGSPMAVGFQ